MLMLNFSYSQGSKNIEMSKGNIELLKELKKQEDNRLSRVEAYLAANPETTITVKDDISITHIYDVIDGVVLYMSTDNINAARGTKTTHLQSGGSLGLNLDGSGMTVGVWDGGPSFGTHPEFANATNTGSRITILDNSTVDGDVGFSSHGTHVTGTISAKGASVNALGMAPNVNIKSYNWSNDFTEMLLAITNGADPILLSNHSYGIPINGPNGQQDASYMGAYTQRAVSSDNIAKNNPKYLMVSSAGNSGTVSYTGGLFPGFDKLTAEATAKNILVIANANPALAPFTYELTNLVINGSSSQGPTDDLRIKPDLAADGTNLFSTFPNNAYGTISGTSMAAPNTTGTLVLLQQYYNQVYGEYMNSSTLKGLVCHTSIDDNARVGPDPVFGWGFLDAKASIETIMDDMNGEAVLDELNLAQGEIYSTTFSAQAGDKLIASICWTDMPGNVVANGDLNNSQPRLVNDLDLRLSKDGIEFLPWKLDYSNASGFSNSKGDNVVDNIERVEIDAPTAGVYTLTVSHKGLLKGNVGGPFDPQTQDFALILTGNSITLGVDDFDLSSNLSVYPNPNNGEFNIKFSSAMSDPVTLNIYDIQGRIIFQNVYKQTAEFNETIKLNKVQSGVYLLGISSGDSSITKKIIVN